MSGLDGLGWPTEPIDEDEIMITDTCQDCSKLPCICGIPAGYSDTPRTDKFYEGERISDDQIFAEELERELTAARQEIERLDVAGIHSCHDKCQRPSCVLRRELDAARAEADKWEKLYDQDTDHLTFMHLRDNYGAIETLDETAKRICAELKAARAEITETQQDYNCLAELLDGHDATECRMNLVRLKEDYINLVKCNEILTQDGERWRDLAISMEHQRDRLVEALNDVMNSGDSTTMYRTAKVALQSLTTNDKSTSTGATE
jgi:hypothetical protein